MERQEDSTPESAPQAERPSEKRPYEAPRVEAVRLSKEAAESLT